VEWKDTKGTGHHIELVTTEGAFNLSTFLQDKARINDTDIPITVSLEGTLNVHDSEHGRLKLFFGRTVPYITGTSTGNGGMKTSQYSQHQVGLSSVFAVTFGTSLQIQSDETDTVTLTVKRLGK